MLAASVEGVETCPVAVAALACVILGYSWVGHIIPVQSHDDVAIWLLRLSEIGLRHSVRLRLEETPASTHGSDALPYAFIRCAAK